MHACNGMPVCVPIKFEFRERFTADSWWYCLNYTVFTVRILYLLHVMNLARHVDGLEETLRALDREGHPCTIQCPKHKISVKFPDAVSIEFSGQCP